MEHYSLIINGQAVGHQLPTIDVTNPATNEVIATVPKAGRAEAEAAVDAAAEAFKTWSRLTQLERSNYVHRWHELIADYTEELARTMTMEQGKPLAESRGEIGYANGFVDWYAEEGKRIYGEIIPASHVNKRIFIHKQPVGVVAVITPWNFPAAMITRKVAPALASGCTVVIKPANYTPLTALKLVQLAHKAGIPNGVVNILTGDSRVIGDAWLQDERVRKLTFTGSTEVGKQLMRGAADTVKKISLELGGHAPSIVTAAADLNKAADGVLAAKFRNAGQTCVCINRVYVHETIVDDFVAVLVEKAKALKVGNGLDEGVTIGPLIDAAAVAKVQQHVDDAATKGGTIALGGHVHDGLFFAPTIVSGVTDEMICMTEETFGPLLPIATYKTEDEVIARANDSIYGLAAYVFTQDISEGIRIAEQLEYGIVGLNDGLPSTPQAPFGGFKQSGLGREGGHHGMDEYLEIKYISLGL